MITAIGLSLYAWAAYVALLRRRFHGWIDTVMAAFVLTLGQILASELLTGFAGLLKPIPLIVANLLLSTIVLLTNRRYIVSTCLDFLRRLRAWMMALSRSPISLVVGLLYVAILAWTLWLIWVLPENSYDGLAYHLPIALSRLDLADMSRLSGWPPWIHSYPECSELLMLWSVIFDRTLTFVDGVQWPFWIAAATASYGLARKLEIPSIPAFQGSAVIGFAPVVALQSRTAYNDLMVGALFLISLNMLLADKGLLSAFVAGLSSSIIAGIKYAGLLYPLFTGIGLLAVDWSKKEAGIGRSSAPYRLLAFITPIAMLTLPWYIGNWITYGNPLWPFTLYCRDKLLFDGLFTLNWLYRDLLRPEHRAVSKLILSPYFWLEPVSRYAHDARTGGLGALWIVLGVPSLVYTVVTFPSRKRRLWLWICLITGGLYLAIPSNWWPRYVLFLPSLGAISLAWTLHFAPVSIKRFAQGMLILGILFSVLTTTAAALASPQEIVAYSHFQPAHRPALGMLDKPAYRWLNCNTSFGSTVAYGYGLYFIAPLWGGDLHNKVVYAGNSEEALAATIAKNGPEFVFVERNAQNAWLEHVPSLAKVYADEQFTIFWVDPDPEVP